MLKTGYDNDFSLFSETKHVITPKEDINLKTEDLDIPQLVKDYNRKSWWVLGSPVVKDYIFNSSSPLHGYRISVKPKVDTPGISFFSGMLLATLNPFFILLLAFPRDKPNGFEIILEKDTHPENTGCQIM